MPSARSKEAPNPLSAPKRAAKPESRASSLRLLPLLLVGVLLVGGALWLRSSPWMREAILRGQDLPELEAAVLQHPDDSIAQYYLAKRYYMAHRYAEALTAYQTAERLDPGAARTHLGLGMTLYDMGRLNPAQEEFTLALNRDNRLAWAECMLGKILWQEGNSQAALPHARRATELDPRSADVWYGLALCTIQTGHRDEAVAPMRQAVARNEGNPNYHTTLGELLVFLGKTEEGRQEYARALQLDPNYGPAVALMGGLYLHNLPGKDSLVRAEELLLRATHLPTYHPQDVYLDLGHLYFQKGQYRKAVPMLEQAIRKDPRDERPYYQLAQVERRLGDIRAAEAANARFQYISKRHVVKDDLEMHLRQSPADMAAHLKLARVYAELGMASQAIGQYRACLQLQPGSAEIARELDAFVQQRQQVAPAH